MDYLDFELNIEALDGDRIRVTLESSPVGSVSIETANPFTPDDIARIVGVLDGSVRMTRGEAARAARTFGEKLFSAIFSGQVYAAYLASRAQAGESGLRIKLDLSQAAAFEDWPWELLRDPNADYLVLSRQTPLVRFPRVLTIRPLVDVALPLRVLVLIASPRDQERLDVEAEWRALLDSTADLRNRGLLEMQRIDDAQLTSLQRELRQGTSYQIFHYIGHAAFDERSQSGMLAFVDPLTGNTMAVSGEGLARELSEENSIRLVVLNACQGARQNRRDPYAGIASSIVARGVPAVVAMQFAITDNASRAFTHEFYRALCEGYPIEASMAEARRAISSTLGNLEWVTPVLYLRAQSGVLFPKRTSAEVSTGGLREAILRLPVLLALGALTVIAVAILISAINNRSLPATPTPDGGPQVATLTPTPPGQAADIDLVAQGLRFSPPGGAAPGRLVSVVISVQNIGKSASGSFTWAWFARDPREDPTPSLQDQFRSLSPGQKVDILPVFRFPWWGSYVTTLYVNFDTSENRVPESNIFNNLLVRSYTTTDDPFEVDFTALPNGRPLDIGPLQGDEYAAWGFRIRPQIGPAAESGECAGAVVKVGLVENFNQITTGLPDSEACADLPVVFTIEPPNGGAPIGSMSVEFIPSVAGAYVLDLLTTEGRALQTERLTVDADGIGQQTALTLTAFGAFPVPAVVSFQVPEGGVTAIRKITFMLPQTP